MCDVASACDPGCNCRGAHYDQHGFVHERTCPAIHQAQEVVKQQHTEATGSVDDKQAHSEGERGVSETK